MDMPHCVLFCAMIWAHCAESVENVQKQHAAVQVVRASAGLVFYEYQLAGPGVLMRNSYPAAPEVLVELLGVDYFATPVEATLGNGGIDHLNRLNQLRRLTVSYPIEDADLVHLQGLTKLRSLDLGGCPITDAGLKHLEVLTELEYLGIWSTVVSDAGLDHLRTLKQLRALDLGCTQVSDAGLERLGGFKQLRSLNVEHARVTIDGVERLRKALPDCEVIY